MTDPAFFPLPRQVIEQVGENWWHPEHIVSNGAFCLVTFNPEQGYALERNPAYFGDFPGNLERVEFHIVPDIQESVACFQRGELDSLYIPAKDAVPELVPLQVHHSQMFGTDGVFLYPRPPLDDRRVRLALAHSLDRKALYGAQYTPGCGGYVPRGLAGHSPGICLPYDPELARRLMAEAGYPRGRGFPVLHGSNVFYSDFATEIARQWRSVLGIRVELIYYKDLARLPLEKRNLHMTGLGGYPDPHSNLQDAFGILMRTNGWAEAPFEEYVERAAVIPERARRMALARQADHLLVAEQALVIPLAYYGTARWTEYLQPWVQGFRRSPLNLVDYRQIIIEPH